MTKYCCSLDQY